MPGARGGGSSCAATRTTPKCHQHRARMRVDGVASGCRRANLCVSTSTRGNCDFLLVCGRLSLFADVPAEFKQPSERGYAEPTISPSPLSYRRACSRCGCAVPTISLAFVGSRTTKGVANISFCSGEDHVRWHRGSHRRSCRSGLGLAFRPGERVVLPTYTRAPSAAA